MEQTNSEIAKVQAEEIEWTWNVISDTIYRYRIIKC